MKRASKLGRFAATSYKISWCQLGTTEAVRLLSQIQRLPRSEIATGLIGQSCIRPRQISVHHDADGQPKCQVFRCREHYLPVQNKYYPSVMQDTLFENSSDLGAKLQESVQTLFGPGAGVSVGTTSQPAIPATVSGQGGAAADQATDRKAVLVRCGPQSKGLCALFFDEQETATGFMKANAISSQTLITRALSRELILWFRCSNWMPSNRTIGHMRWLSEGLIPVVLFHENLESRVLRWHPIATVQFSDFKWDAESDRVFWLARQEFLFGPVFQNVGPRKRVLNDSIVCRAFAKDARIVFDATGQRFCREGEPGILEYLSPETVLEQFTAWLTQWASRCGTSFPANELRLARVKSMISHLKLVAAAYEPDPWEGLISYIKKRLCRSRDADVTMEEIHVDYDRYAKQSGIGRFPLCRFQQVFPKLIEEVFGIVRAHNIERWNEAEKKTTSRRGFNGLGFRSSTDDTDASDAKLQNDPEPVLIDVASPPCPQCAGY